MVRAESPGHPWPARHIAWTSYRAPKGTRGDPRQPTARATTPRPARARRCGRRTGMPHVPCRCSRRRPRFRTAQGVPDRGSISPGRAACEGRRFAPHRATMLELDQIRTPVQSRRRSSYRSYRFPPARDRRGRSRTLLCRRPATSAASAACRAPRLLPSLFPVLASTK